MCCVVSFFIPKFLKDSSAFDAKSYYEQLITTSSLPALLKRENELLAGMSSLPLIRITLIVSLAEIRQLDGERQSLVYNRHHELIAAGDTISAVCLLPITLHLSR